MESLPFFCGKDCGGNACPLLALVENGRVVQVINNPAAGETIKGCWRGFTLPHSQYAPDRILKPLMRVGPRGSGVFRETSWDEALDLTAARLLEIREKHGPNSVLNLSSAGSLGALHVTFTLLSRFLAFFGGYTGLSSNYSNGAASFVLPYLLGSEKDRAGFDAATMQYSDMIVLWGANILETRFGSELPQRLLEAKKRGAQIVVIDPRRSATVKFAGTWWLPCRPGTDAALMLAVLHVLLKENLVDRLFIETHSAGFDQLEAYVLGQDGGEAHTPEWASAICGLPAEEIARFARAYGAAKPAMLVPGYSIQRVFAGEETYRLTVALQVATGNFGRRGGSTGAMNNLLPAPRAGSLSVPPRMGLPTVRVVRWADAVLEGTGGGYPTDIRAIYSVGGNYLNQGSDIHKNMAAFQKVDFAVSHEMFLTPTARFCDVVFPAASPFEKEDIGMPWLGNYLLYKPRVVEPLGEARSDYAIFCDLAGRMNFQAEFSEGRDESGWVQYFMDQSEVPDQRAFRETGIYLHKEQERVGLADFYRDPQRHPLSTPSGKVEIASQRYHQETGFPAIPTWQAPANDSRYPLRLITPKSPYRTHSQGSNIAVAQDKARHALEMHPQDAAARGIQDGEIVLVFNDQGTARIPARVSADLVQGIVSLPEGVWANLDEQGIDTAGAANMFSSTEGTLPGRANIMHAVPVEVRLPGYQAS